MNLKKNNNIYKIINNISIDNDIQIVNKHFTDYLDLWYNDNALLNELYKCLKINYSINILKDIVIWYNNGNSGQTSFVITHHYGYDDMPNSLKKHYTSYLDYQLYYHTQILECKNNIMAIPIIIYINNDLMSHSNMLIIKRQRDNFNKIIVEYFEPYGYLSCYDITFEILYLISELFSSEIISPNDIKIIYPMCNCSIQKYLIDGLYSDCCSIICIWYAINRLFTPENDPNITCINMVKYLTISSPNKTIKKIILSFVSLLYISDKGIINNKKIIDKNILKKLLKEIY